MFNLWTFININTLTALFISTLFVFTGVPSASADGNGRKGQKSPESTLICSGAFGHQISVASGIDSSLCTTPDTLCADCVVSLEQQGCRIIETHVLTGPTKPFVTYLMSCVKP